MEFRHDTHGDVTVIMLRGRLDELAASETEQGLSQWLEERPAQVVLDLSGVEYISSSGLRVLLMTLKAVQRYGGQLRLCGLTPFVAEVFEIGNFTVMFETYPDQEAAITACSASGSGNA